MATFAEIADVFQSVDPDTRLELLLEYAGRLPPLDARHAALRDAGADMVHECQAPVFLVVEAEGGRVRVHADVPREAPTARGFTSILVEAFDGATPAEIAAAPADALRALGLSRLLGMQRTRGLSAIYAKVRRSATAA